MMSMESLQLDTPRTARPVLDFDQASELAAEHGTPLLVISRSRLVETYWAMKHSMPDVELYYAAKSNPDLHILSTLNEENAFVDICSEGEMIAALNAGFSPSRMLHTHPCKTESNLLACYEAGVRWFVFDSEQEAEKIARLAPDVHLLLRLAVSATSSMINLSAKFGAPLDSAIDTLEAAGRLGLDVRGMSFHVGSQCTDPEDYRNVLRDVRQVWDNATERGFQLEVLDIGGGFPAPYISSAPSMASFGQVVSEGLREHFGGLSIRFIAEPGRGLSAECTTLITKVIGTNTRWGMPWYFIDDGLYGSFSGKVFDHGDFPLLYQNDGEREVGMCIVAGPTCDSGDVVCRNQLLPSLEVNELLLVPTMGAYAGASASPFNGLPVAKSVMID